MSNSNDKNPFEKLEVRRIKLPTISPKEEKEKKEEKAKGQILYMENPESDLEIGPESLIRVLDSDEVALIREGFSDEKEACEDPVSEEFSIEDTGLPVNVGAAAEIIEAKNTELIDESAEDTEWEEKTLVDVKVLLDTKIREEKTQLISEKKDLAENSLSSEIEEKSSAENSEAKNNDLQSDDAAVLHVEAEKDVKASVGGVEERIEEQSMEESSEIAAKTDKEESDSEEDCVLESEEKTAPLIENQLSGKEEHSNEEDEHASVSGEKTICTSAEEPTATDGLEFEVTDKVGPAIFSEETTKIDIPIPTSDEVRISPAVLRTHQTELKRMCVFACAFLFMGLLPYTSDALAEYRPWIPGERTPLVSLVVSSPGVTATADGSLEREEKEEEEPEKIEEEEKPVVFTDPIITQLKSIVQPVKDRLPAKAEELVIPKGSLDKYFKSLALAEDGMKGKISRALIWGDSTIANDGVIKDVRKRIQDRFGDGGPGFLAVQVDSKWSIRRDILRKPRGWKTKTIVYGGSHSGRYGLAGTVSTAYGPAQSVLGGTKMDGTRQKINRFQIFYEFQPRGGTISASTNDQNAEFTTKAEEYKEGFYEIRTEKGSENIKLKTKDGRVTMYGVAMETSGPGATWETFGVAGSSVRSMRNQPLEHLKEQVMARNPDLVVYWTGGNELGYPSLKSKTGRAYKKLYRKSIRKIKDGADNASCLLISPLDQATRVRGRVVSKPTLKKIIKFQMEVASEMGCAYWNAQKAMGGDGSFRKWMKHKPKLAGGDLVHLTKKGRALIGQTLADSLIHAYDLWRLKNPEVQWSPGESFRDPPPDDILWESERKWYEETVISCNDETGLEKGKK